MTNSLISPRLIILVTLFALLLAMAWSGSYAAPVAADHPFPCGGADEPPCEPPDGTLGGDPVIDTVNDISGSSANTGASIFIDASVLEQLPQPVAIDVTIFTHQGPPVLPNPRTLFVDFILNPNPTPPDLPGAGATITLPLFSSGTPGANVYLYDSTPRCRARPLWALPGPLTKADKPQPSPESPASRSSLVYPSRSSNFSSSSAQMVSTMMMTILLMETTPIAKDPGEEVRRRHRPQSNWSA